MFLNYYQHMVAVNGNYSVKDILWQNQDLRSNHLMKRIFETQI